MHIVIPARGALAGLLAASFISFSSVFGATRAESKGGVVVSGSRESTEAGLEVLRRGGSAADAAVAVSLALGVSEPFNSGLGGKFIALYYDASKQSVRCIEALDQASDHLDLNAFLHLPKEDREKGYTSVCVPGLVAGVSLMHKTWGTMPWAECVQPAISLARKGYAVPDKQLTVYRDKADVIRSDAEATKIFLPGGKVPHPDQMIQNPDLVTTLQRLADKGPEDFYHGETARLIVAASEAAGGYLTMEDFARYKAHWLDPLSVDYAGKEIYTSPAPLTGGAIVLLALKALELDKNKDAQPLSLTRVDAAARVFQQIYPLVAGGFADTPDSEKNSARIFKQATYASIWKKASEADPRSPFDASVDRNAVTEDSSGNTTHYVVVDRQGNIACVTQSLAYHFGSGVVAPGTGILLNDCMANFSYSSPRAINYVAPGKRPRSTMAPTIVLENHRPYLALGSPAAQRIPTGVYQVLSAVLDYNETLVNAVDEPRFHTRSRRTSGEAPNILDLEVGFNTETSDELGQRHWDVQSKSKNSYYFGGVNAVRFLPDGKREAVADDRRTNWAAGE